MSGTVPSRWNFWGPLGVALFELRRSFSPGRISLWLLMAGFPVVLVSAVLWLAMRQPPDQPFSIILFALIVRVSCVMGLLLWATPVISSEVEGKTWVYIVSRPTASRSVLMGKYLVAILWAISAGLVSASVTVPISGIAQPFRLWSTLCLLVVLGSLAYGALLSLIGSLIQRRAMVAAIVYLVFIEGVISLLPATINRFTVGYRLLAILANQLEIEADGSPQIEMMLGTSPTWFHVLFLLGYTVLLLALALGRVRLGGYMTSPED